MFCITNDVIKQKVQAPDTSSCLSSSIPVTKLYLSHLSDNKGILITSIKKGYKTENKIPLKFEHSDHFDLLQLSYKGPEFHDYFPLDATFKISKMLLKNSTTIHKNLNDGQWDIIHIETEKESDCLYLFEKAIEDKYTVIIALLLEIIDANNSSRKLAIYQYTDYSTPLHRAVEENDTTTIKALHNYKLDINAQNELGWTPLHVAVNLEMSDVVDLLISKGADVHVQDDLNQTPFHFAAKRNNSKIINSFIKSQAKLNEKDDFGQTPLHYAVVAGNVDIVDILLKNNADYKLKDLRDRTPFHLAVKRRNFDIIKVFFENNINLQDSQGFTPSYVAEIVLNYKFIRVLLKYNADTNIQVMFGRNILHLACQHLGYKCIRTLLNFNIDINAVDNEGKTALHVAVERKYYRVVELILNKNANINMCDNHGKTALHLAIELRLLPIIEFLLKNGANVDLGDESGSTALHLAVKSVYDRVVELSLKNNVDVSLTNASEETALHIPLKTTNISKNIIIFIVSLTNDINAIDSIGRTAVHYAALYHKFNILRYILQNNGNVNARDSEGKTPLHVTMNPRENCFQCVKVLLDYNTDINAVDNDLISSLHLACFTKNVKVVKYLIENGADSSMRDKDGRTVFHYVCMNKLNGMSLCINNMKKHIEDTLNVLVAEENISVNCCDNFGKTPLHYAAENNWSFITNKVLLNIGADINIVDKDHNSPFDNLKKQYFHVYSSLNDLATLYKQHVIKMKVIKLWVRETYIEEVYRVYHEDHLKCIQLYEYGCSREIDLMKSTNLGDRNISYYDFLKKSPHDAVNYTRNHNVVNAIQSDGLIKMFPIYGYFVKCHLREAQRRSNLYEQIQESLKSNVFKKLPILCMFEIFRYLDNSELNMLLNAMKPIVLVK